MPGPIHLRPRLAQPPSVMQGAAYIDPPPPLKGPMAPPDKYGPPMGKRKRRK